MGRTPCCERKGLKKGPWGPEEDEILINYINKHGHGSWRSLPKLAGIIARNRKGLVMAACTFPWENVSDPVTAEARACLQAITMAEEMGFRYICIEGDVLTIVRKLNSAEEDRSSVSSLIQEIKERKPIFRSLSFQYVPRVANIVAHEMAKEGCCYEFPRFLIEEAPPTVESLVNQDRRNGVVER